jgi:hypothetical protein
VEAGIIRLRAQVRFVLTTEVDHFALSLAVIIGFFCMGACALIGCTGSGSGVLSKLASAG